MYVALGSMFWPIQPMTGPPIGVVPIMAVMYSAITRPRTETGEVSWSVAEFIVMNATLPLPTNSRAIAIVQNVGMNAATSIVTPRNVAAKPIRLCVARPNLAISSPPATDPIPIIDDSTPYPVASRSNVNFANSGSAI